MKKLFFYAMLAVGMTAACQKPDVNGDVDELDDNSPVEVVFGVNAPSITVTKTKAAVDDWTADHTVYVYGFDKSLTSLEDGTDGKSPMLINGEAANVVNPTGTDSDLEADDVSALKFGNHASPNDAVEKKFYYGVDKVYDFVGYYTGKPETVTPKGTTLSGEVTIDGSHDVMLAYADPQADVDKANMNMKTDRVYSAFAARRNVHPTLNFEHMLTRFSFDVVRGKTPNISTVKDVNVTEVYIETANTGTLTVAPISNQKFVKGNSTAKLSVKGIADGGQTPKDGTPTDLGEDIMIFPGDKEVTFYVSLEPTDKGDPNLSEITLDPMKVVLNAEKITGDTDATFEAGKKYSVLLTVYGLEQVQVSASLREWDEVDEWTFDPDDEYADQVTVTSITATNTATSEAVTLYHTAKVFKEGVSVYTDKELTTPADNGDYSTTIESTPHTFTVEDGKVTNFN